MAAYAPPVSRANVASVTNVPVSMSQRTRAWSA